MSALTSVLITCHCGTRDLAPADLLLTVINGGQAVATYYCAGCDLATSRPVPPTKVHALTSAGVPLVELPAPEQPTGAVLTRDDLLDLHLALVLA